jgi:hypothetical protein
MLPAILFMLKSEFIVCTAINYKQGTKVKATFKEALSFTTSSYCLCVVSVPVIPDPVLPDLALLMVARLTAIDCLPSFISIEK